MTYATVEDVQGRMTRTMPEAERDVCQKLLEDAAVIIDAVAPRAAEEKKSVVSCRMVMRALGDGADAGIPMGTTQGSQSALGYSQSWTFSNGASGEVYLSKLEKQLLGLGSRIGMAGPLQHMCGEDEKRCEG